MEEYFYISGTLVALDLAVEITGLSEDELRLHRNYLCVDVETANILNS